MAEIIMPKMGDAMTEGKVVQWYKKAGDSVKKGEPILEIETDKVNLDLEAEEDGVLGKIEVEAGSMVDVGTRLSWIGDGAGAPPKKAAKKEEKKAAKKEEKKEEPTAVEPVPAQPPAEAPPEQAAPAAPQPSRTAAVEFVRSSPLARRMAKDLGVELSSVAGSGPGGRVIAADVKKASEQKPRARAAGAPPAQASMPPAAGLEEKEIPLSGMRRTIARRLSESIGPIPHFFLTIDLDVTDLMRTRAQLNDIQPVKTSVNDFVIRAAALAILHHPNVNASFTGESIRQHGHVHMGIAVATPEGLLTPVIRDADQQSVPQIASASRDLAERARNRKLKPNEYEGSTFTISNLGMFGIEEFTAIINPPNSAILAVGSAMSRPVVVDGEIVVRERMKITMSCDHRVIDGAAGAEYLRTLRQYLEQPLRLIVS